MAKKKNDSPQVRPVETLAEEANVPAWELAALRQATGWAEGRQVTQDEFDSALGQLRNRPVGGGAL